jgi:hypothetical protein
MQADKAASSSSARLKAFGLPAVGIQRDLRRLAAGDAAVGLETEGFQ